jgi:putative phage-type endonuclease
MHQKVEYLLTLPKIEQKSQEWYEIRKNMITASDFAQALGDGKFGTVEQFYKKKCVPESDVFVSNPFFKWGNMFEDVALRIYEHIQKTTIYQFGLLKHPNYDFFGASPDGITADGIMVEIKCPMKRKIIPGDVPQQYYYQIQGQLDVCDLNDCDYFECEFSIVNYEKLCDGGSGGYRGVILEYQNEAYAYSPDVNLSVEELKKWESTQPSNPIKRHIWKLEKYNMVRVEKNKEFISQKMKLLEQVWQNILRYRKDKDLYELEIGKNVAIETERYCDYVKLNGWSFIETSDHTM